MIKKKKKEKFFYNNRERASVKYNYKQHSDFLRKFAPKVNRDTCYRRNVSTLRQTRRDSLSPILSATRTSSRSRTHGSNSLTVFELHQADNSLPSIADLSKKIHCSEARRCACLYLFPLVPPKFFWTISINNTRDSRISDSFVFLSSDMRL